MNYRISVDNIYADIKVKKRRIKDLAQIVLAKEGISKAEINIILVDDQYVIRLNQEFLNKDTTTDVLSFILTDETDDQLEGEVYANIEQIIRQADDYHVPFETELTRILIHGLLHLAGFRDETNKDKQIMTEKEDQYLAMLNNKL